MRIVATKVVKKYGDVVHNASLSISLIMHCSDVEAGDMILVSDFAIVGDEKVEGAVLTVADATHDRIVMFCLLFTKQGSHSVVYFEVFHEVSLPPDVLVEELVY